MSTNFPTSTDSYTHPNPNDPRSGTTSLSTQFSNIQDAVVALETKVGINSSADNTSQDYKLSGVATGDKAVSKTGTETLTAKTLTAPKINIGGDATGDIYYRDSGGNFQRLPAPSDGSIISYSGGIPVGIPNPAASNASLTVKGVGQEATQALTDAGTELGSTGAINIITPVQLRARLLNTGVADSGSANAYVITPSPAITAYAVYQEFSYKAANTNTGASTLAVNGLSVKTIKRTNGADLSPGDIIAGQIVTCVYDGTNFQLTSFTASAGLFACGTGTVNGSTVTITHGLNVIPRLIEIYAVVAGSAVTIGDSMGTATSTSTNSSTWKYQNNSTGWTTGQDASNIIHTTKIVTGSPVDQDVAAITSITTTTVVLTASSHNNGNFQYKIYA